MDKAVIFDFDGLILDTETLHIEIYNEMFSECGVSFPYREWIQNIGSKGHVSIYDLLDREIGTKETDRELWQTLNKNKFSERVSMLEARPGVVDYLEDAKAEGFRIGLASSSDYEWVTTHLGNLDLINYFESIRTSDDVENVKPDPALYNLVVEDLGVSLSNCLVFEDSANGALAALRAGLPCIIVPNSTTRHLQFPEVKKRMDSMSDLSFSELLESVKQT